MKLKVLSTFTLIAVFAITVFPQERPICVSSECQAYIQSFLKYLLKLQPQTSRTKEVLDDYENDSAKLSEVATVFRSAKLAEGSAFRQFSRRRVPSEFTWIWQKIDKIHRLFQSSTFYLSRAASLRSQKDLRRGNQYLFQLDAEMKQFDQDTAEYAEQLKQFTRAQSFLSEKARLSLKEGELYAAARKILVADGWTPINNYQNLSEIDREHNVVKNLRFYEMEACSGTGMGYCNFIFENKIGKILTITTFDNEEAEPRVSGFRID